MNGFTRNRASLVHPNAVVAKRELERQERLRLQRLAEVKGRMPRPTSASGMRAASGRPGSAAPGGRDRDRERTGDLGGNDSPLCGRIRPRSRPPSAPSQRSWTGPVDSPPVNESPAKGYAPSSRSAAAAPTGVTAAEKAASAASSAARGRRAASEVGPTRLRTSFMVSPQRRFEDTQAQLQMNSEKEHQALMEELQGWYFGAAELSELNILGPSSLRGSRTSLEANSAGSPPSGQLAGSADIS